MQLQFPIYLYYYTFLQGIPEQVEEYKKLVKASLKRDHKGDPVLPKYYFVNKDVVEYEKAEPGTQLFQPSAEGSGSNLFLWGQSIYVVASLLTAGLVHVNELDLIRQYLPSNNRPLKVGRYSTFQVLNWLIIPRNIVL